MAKAGLYWRQPGASLSGPVKIPGLYDGKDKTFFMYNWEQIRSEVPFPQVYTVPTALERQGDFSQTRTADGRPVTIYDPLTTRLVNGTYVRDAFPGNQIPANRIDPVARAILDRVPMPNANALVNNLLVPDNARADKYDQHVLKVDQVMGQSQRFFARFARNKRTEINDYAAFPPEASPWYQHGRTNLGLAAEHTAVLSPSVVLSSRAGFIRHEFYVQVHGDGFDPTQLGFPASFGSQVERQTFPQIQWDGFTTFGSTFGGNNGSVFTTSDVWSWSEVLSKTMGSHAFKMGGEFRAIINDQQNPTSSSGRFTFNRAFTQADPTRADVTAGNSVASLLLGYPADSSTTANPSLVPINPLINYRSNYYGLFLQDDWRVSPKLTINAGVRWDYESPNTEKNNQQNIGFDGTATSPFTAPGLSLRGGLLFASEDNPLPFKRDLNNFQPRFGMTYQVNDKTVMRGGYAMAYLPTFDHGFNNGFSVNSTLVTSTDGGITPSARLSNPYPAGLDQPVGSSQGLATLVGRPFTFSNPDRTIPYVHQYSIGVQRELPGNMVVDAAYVGSRTRGIVVSKGINEISAAQLAQGNAMLAAVANPFQGLLPGTAFNGATVPLQQLVRPYPQFGSITEDRRSLGTSDYDSLQLSLNKRMSKGVQFLVSYTYGRTMEEVAYLNPQDDWDQLLRVATERDAPHRLMLSGNWSLPFFTNSKGVVGSLFGGWQANGIVVFQSGIPTAGPAANAAGGAFLVGDPTIDNPTLDRAFNTCTHGDQRHASELRDAGRGGGLADPAAVHAAHAADALRRHPREAAGPD